jgi:hypothetical protein
MNRAVKRLVILAALASCADDECDREPRSRVTNHDLRLTSGREVIGVTWERSTAVAGADRTERFGALVFADGTRTEASELQRGHSVGTAGTSSVLWHGSKSLGMGPCGDFSGIDVTLQLQTHTQLIPFSQVPTTMTASFDGRRYQLFWRAHSGNIHHRSIDEDGTLGPVHDLVTPSPSTSLCLAASSDRDGTTYLIVNREGFLVDTTTGATTTIWTAPDQMGFAQSFAFANRWYVVEGGSETQMLWSFDATTKTATRREFPREYAVPRAFHPGTTSLFIEARTYINTGIVIIETDTELRPVASRDRTSAPFAVFENDLVSAMTIPANINRNRPGSLALEREDAWQSTIVQDSPLCGDDL